MFPFSSKDGAFEREMLTKLADRVGCKPGSTMLLADVPAFIIGHLVDELASKDRMIKMLDRQIDILKARVGKLENERLQKLWGANTLG